MIDQFFSWAFKNWVEILGTIFGIAYVFYSIKQKIVTWFLGLITSLLYIYVFFISKFYADMSLQFYYVWISAYGWIVWSKGKQTQHGREVLPVVSVKRKQLFILSYISVFLWILIYLVLKKFTDSPVPVGDALTTSLSIVGTWMLARKILENWLIWVVVDFISILLFLYKELYPTVVLFAIYTVAAFWGYLEWKKEMQKNVG